MNALKFVLIMCLIVLHAGPSQAQFFNPDSLENVADSLARLNQTNEAQLIREKAAESYLNQERYEEAYNLFLLLSQIYTFDGNLDKGAQYEKSAIQLYQSHFQNDTLSYISLERMRCNNLKFLGFNDSSAIHAKEVVRTFPNMYKYSKAKILFYEIILNSYVELKRFEQAAIAADSVLLYLNQYKDSLPARMQISALFHCSESYYHNQDRIKSLEALNQAELIAENSPKISTNLQLVIKHAKALNFKAMGLNELALETLLEGVPLSMEVNKYSKYTAIGGIYLDLEQPQKAAQYFEKAFALADSFPSITISGFISSIYLKACAYSECDTQWLNRFTQDIFSSSVRSSDSCSVLQHYMLLNNNKNEQYSTFLDDIKRADDIITRVAIPENKAVLTNTNYGLWADYYKSIGDWEKALAFTQKQIEYGQQNDEPILFQETYFRNAIDLSRILNYDSLVVKYLGLWQAGIQSDTTGVWKDLYYLAKGEYFAESDGVDSAFKYFELAARELDLKLLEIGENYDLIRFFERRDNDIDRAVHFFSRTEEAASQQLFKLHELRKAYAFRRQLIPELRLITSDSLSEITTLIQEKKGIIKYLKREKEKQGASEDLKQNYEAKILEVDQELELLRLSLKEDYPAYASFINEQLVADFSALQSYVNKHEVTYCSYDVLNDSTISVLCIAPDGASTRRVISLSYSLQQAMSAMHSALNSGEAALFNKWGNALYKDLVLPIQAYWQDHVIISCSGILQQLNFEFLPTNEISTTFQENQFLIEQYTFAQVLSFSQMQLAEQFMNENNSVVSVFVPGFLDHQPNAYASTMDASSLTPQLLSLNAAKQWIDLFGKAKQYFEDAATKENFIKAMKESGIIHVSSHAFYNEENPYSSYIQFSSITDSLPEGRLSIHELYQLQSAARLAVLLGCETGLGEQLMGEGIASLAHAMNYTGCPNQIFTRWKVDEKASNEIIQNFYQEIKDGVSYVEALRNAKLQFLRQDGTPQYTNPYYWGGVVMMGGTLSEPQGFSYGWLLTLVGLVVLAWAWFRFRK